MAVSFNDVAQLQLDQPDQIDWSQYRDAQATPEPVPDDVYDVQAPDQILFTTWEKDGRSYLRIAGAQGETGPLTVISEGPAKGRKLFYPFITNRKYRNSMGSQMGDYIRAFGIAAQPTTHAEYAQLVQATANRIGKAQTKQEAYCKACDSTVAEGQAACQALVRCPNCNGPVSVRAKIDRWISTVAK